ncbi:MAG: DUF3047 domain-containing protein [Gammaproteobacteria bacterium]|nr:MAG: DUF3047 domain-containing protein [Gammaproteobacteria bacterium]
MILRICLCWVLAGLIPVQAQTISLGLFSQGQRTGWEEKSFAGHTHYSLIADRETGHRVLQAISKGTASGLLLEREIDLNQTPWLEWSWKVVDSSLLKQAGHDEHLKSGDDYAVRLYVIISDPPFFWRTRALNYVWSANQPVGTVWPSPYTENSTLIAVESGTENIGIWRSYRVNLRQDIKRYLGMKGDKINAIAIMSDSDNTKTDNTVLFGDIRLSSNIP